MKYLITGVFLGCDSGVWKISQSLHSKFWMSVWRNCNIFCGYQRTVSFISWRSLGYHILWWKMHHPRLQLLLFCRSALLTHFAVRCTLSSFSWGRSRWVQDRGECELWRATDQNNWYFFLWRHMCIHPHIVTHTCTVAHIDTDRGLLCLRIRGERCSPICFVCSNVEREYWFAALKIDTHRPRFGAWCGSQARKLFQLPGLETAPHIVFSNQLKNNSHFSFSCCFLWWQILQPPCQAGIVESF